MIDVNKNIKLTKYKREPFAELAGVENIDILKEKWLKEYGPVPDPMEEQQLFKQALEEAGIDPAKVVGKDEKKEDDKKKDRRFKHYRVNK